jgi:hypothetical protein
VFAHCDYFKIPENKDSWYLTEDMQDSAEHGDRTNASVSCIINLDKSIDTGRRTEGKYDETISECFELEFFVSRKRFPWCFYDERKFESYPNMMHHGASYYWLHFKK